MSCEHERTPFRCPTEPETRDQLFARLPWGRAWQTHESGPDRPIEQAFDPEVFQPDAFQTQYKEGSILYRFWAAFAALLHFVTVRLCALRMEFWCATHSETHAEWMEEYGLPDDCDPFPDLCQKVAALGGTRCEYYAEVAARAGWSIRCEDGSGRCEGLRMNSKRFGQSGAVMGGGPAKLSLRIVVNLGESIAFVGPRGEIPRYGRFRMGQRLICGPSLTPLKCILDRVVHAHVPIEYVTE